MELLKEAKYPTKKTRELAKSNFARQCCCAAVQKGHMIEQVINKRNQRVCREIHKTVNTAEKSGRFVDLSRRLFSSVLSSQQLLQVSAWKISAEDLHWRSELPTCG